MDTSQRGWRSWRLRRARRALADAERERELWGGHFGTPPSDCERMDRRVAKLLARVDRLAS